VEVEIKDELQSVTGITPKYTLTVLKNGPTKMFKRKVARKHNPHTHCPSCKSQLEAIEVKTSNGRYIGNQMYCGHCDAAVAPFDENDTWLVAELNGVRVYANGKNLIMTTEDLQP